jgi:glycine cleavage system T protein (aminomethyltransferase)
MSYVQHLAPFLRRTPFHEPIARLMHGQGWTRWMGFQSPAFFDSEQAEYFAIRHGASVFDISPLIKYAIRGHDAARFVDFLVTRDMSKLSPQRIAYTAWCEDDGRMIEEGTIFRLAGNDFILNAALHQLHWLSEAAYGFDVEIEEITEQICGLALQGPTSREILVAMGIAGIEALAYFGILELTVDGRWLRIDRAGFTGDLGYELWVEPKDALWLWETLFTRGEPWKIAPIGSLALDMARIESGFLLVGADYIGALHAIRPTQRLSPIEAGIGWAVGLNKQSYFVGKRALLREKAEQSSRYILTGLEVEGRKPAPSAILYADREARMEIGVTTSALWSPTLKKNIAFGRVPSPFAEPGRQMWIETWYPKEKKIERSIMRCWACNRSFFDPPRKKL